MSSPFVRRARGLLLRLARTRVAAGVVGIVLIAFSFGLLLCEFSWESWVSDGFGLVTGGTGMALVITSISGRQPDWVE